jgi:RNA polymerase sigma-70 factor (ECF subfamily)
MRSRRRFDTLALPHLPALYRFARQLVGSTKADDLVQETFLRAWAHFDKFDPETNCRAWLLRILHNTWISFWRKSRREVLVADLEPLLIEPYYDWEGELSRDDLSLDMQWALDGVPETYRVAILLADVEELTYREIAGVLGCPIGTVMSRVNRGRRTLKRLLLARREGRSGVVQPEQHRG